VLLQKRARIDDLLKNRFTREITVMFTDMKGMTSYFESRGDIEGMVLLQKHNEILFPIVEGHGGEIIKTVGDSIMASFRGPIHAVRAAVEMQRKLKEYNLHRRENEQIHIRIGVNKGPGLIKEHDIYGDAVNVASRLESLAEAGEILISGAIFQDIKDSEDVLCRYVDLAKVRGKTQPLELYQVAWDEEHATPGPTRAPPRSQLRQVAAPTALHLEALRKDSHLEISTYETGEGKARTIRTYEVSAISSESIYEKTKEIASLLNRANRRGKVSHEILSALREAGQFLYDELLTLKAKNDLKTTEAQDLIVSIDDGLVHIPWELLYDGSKFLCQRFNMGRVVSTQKRLPGTKQRDLAKPLKVLILSDPKGDLKDSRREGSFIRDEADKHSSLMSVNPKSGPVTREYARGKMRNFDVVHYAGHADYDTDNPSQSGWLLADTKFTSDDIIRMAGSTPLPALVFSNACKSGQTEEWKVKENYGKGIYGLANAFLLAGVQHYIGTFWEVLDEPSSQFALAFYRSMLKGCTIGEAVREARLHLIQEYGEETIVWASYLLYGDPSFRYIDTTGALRGERIVERGVEDVPPPAGMQRATIEFGRREPGRSKRMTAFVLAFLVSLLVVLGLLWQTFYQGDVRGRDLYGLGYQGIMARDWDGEGEPLRYEGLAALSYHMGDYPTALTLCEKALENDSENSYGHVIKGNILFHQGRLEGAAQEYRRADELEGGKNWQRAEALTQLGRVYASQGKAQEAAAFYARASTYTPQASGLYANQGVLAERAGNLSQAISFYREALTVNPDDRLASLFLKRAEEKQKLAEDRARQEEIDRLISDLLQTYENQKGEKPKKEEDAWTSKPLTLFLMSFERKGMPALREGEEDYLLDRLASSLQESGRITIVERALLDKLLKELKLSSSGLADPDTALTLGRILAARLIVTGTITYWGDDVAVNLKAIETETTSLKATVSATFKSKDFPEGIIDQLSKGLINKTSKAYPVKGKVASVQEGRVLLNIGSQQGVTRGTRMRIFPADYSALDRKAISAPDFGIGRIEVEDVEASLSYGRIVEGEGHIKAGARAREILTQ
jgi:class 3 adenylate cyclase/CHAT domain-containing protein/Tfp pilus assembly protein PilF